MEQEHFLCGYCRQIDSARTVCAVTQNRQLTEADCCYPDCPFAGGCVIAEGIDKVLQQNEKEP